MRDPNRIPEILSKLELIWKDYPDWRLGQLIVNISKDISGNSDPFYLEDMELLKFLSKTDSEKEK